MRFGNAECRSSEIPRAVNVWALGWVAERENHYAEKVVQMSAAESLSLEQGVKGDSNALFIRLRQLARQSPERIATVSPERSASHRKLWSRVERATARLQGEWAVSAGQLVVYEGPPHADALILWLALCRLGACLLPLERIDSGANGDAPGTALATAQAAPEPLVLAHAASEATLWMHADNFIPTMATTASIPSHSLSSLIMRPCACQPVALQEEGRLDCIAFSADSPAPDRQLRRTSLRNLMAQACQPPTRLDYSGPTVVLDRGMFSEQVLGPVLLPALMAGRCLIFGAAPFAVAQPAAAALR
jgi:hypothetical protein